MPQEALIHLPPGEEEIHVKYLRFLPDGLGRDAARRWPLILFLHGAGERGHDPDILKKHSELYKWMLRHSLNRKSKGARSGKGP
ncbi:MAG: hypothetical protein C4576_22660 [Desulfobacteraceae bacterium]|nr:MAG: hypothetical protein C4576_22660 [Desulfobacteraceae bacterium]